VADEPGLALPPESARALYPAAQALRRAPVAHPLPHRVGRPGLRAGEGGSSIIITIIIIIIIIITLLLLLIIITNVTADVVVLINKKHHHR
jgi:hypothetical protein